MKLSLTPQKLTLAALFLLVIGLSTQCKKDEIEVIDCTGVTPTYTANVKSILDANCATSGCHSSSSKRAGYDLSSYTTSKSAAGNDAFLGAVRHLSGYSKMPRGGSKLSDADIKTLSCWVQNGMPE